MIAVPFSFAQVVDAAPWFPHEAQIEAGAAFLAQLSLSCRDHTRALTVVLNSLSGARSSAVGTCSDRIQSLQLRGTESLAHAAERASHALHRYAATLRAGAAHATRIRAEGDLALTELRRAVARWAAHTPEHMLALADWRRPPESVWQSTNSDHIAAAETAAALRTWHTELSRIAACEQRWQQLSSERDGAERHLLTALRGTSVGAVLSHHPSDHHTQHRAQTVALAGAFSGEVWGQAVATVPALPHGAHVLRLLGGRTTASAWDHPPDPHLVAARWLALTHHQQQHLIRTAPEVVGNLPGLSASVRDQANRTALARLSAHPAALTPLELLTVTEVTAMMQRPRSTQFQLLSFDLSGTMPRVAYALGDVDTARDVTWMIGGMDTDAPTAVRGWATTAQHLYTEQSAAVAAQSSHAVIVWLGYDTPGLVGVLSTDAAHTGAPRLSAELDAMAGRTHTDPVTQRIHVLAHSYGTTLASIALTQVQHPVASFTMLGSAGIDVHSVPQLTRLHVAPVAPQRSEQPAIFTGHANDDGLAPLGAALAGRALPHHNGRIFGSSSHTVTPTLPGALAFSVQGDPHQGLSETDGHSIRGAGERRGMLGVSAASGHGYLDIGTQSLHTVARITTGTLTPGALAQFRHTQSSCITRALPHRPCASHE